MQIANFLKIGSKNYFSRQHGSFLLIYFHRQKMDSRHSDHFITKRMILELPRADRWAIQTDCDWIQSDCKELKNSLNWRKWKPPVKRNFEWRIGNNRHVGSYLVMPNHCDRFCKTILTKKWMLTEAMWENENFWHLKNWKILSIVRKLELF